LLPGANSGSIKGSSLIIDYLDTGTNADFTHKDVNSASYGLPIAKKKWV
jgi:hypothetical protein